MTCGVKQDQVNKTSRSDLLDKLSGKWDPVTKARDKMKHLMNLMEASMGLGGGPVREINFTSRCRQVFRELMSSLGGMNHNIPNIVLLLARLHVCAGLCLTSSFFCAATLCSSDMKDL